MLQPEEALALVLETARRAIPEERPLERAAFLVCARDLPAERPYPFFSYSAMDGYAVRRADLAGATRGLPVNLPLAGEVRAAPGRPPELVSGHTLRIMTGAALPAGADAVIKREEVFEGQNSITFYFQPESGSHINREGEEVERGQVVWPEGAQLSPPALGMLATLGLATVPVYAPPAVTLLTTGDELRPAGTVLETGTVYDSVTPMLLSALRRARVEQVACRRCGDDPDLLREELARAREESDLVLTVGGVSAGDYDHLARAFAEIGVRQVFHQVAQQPGKPLWFGRLNEKLFFGLPGNPASALVCFELYVVPALRQVMGFPEPWPLWLRGRLDQELEHSGERTLFLRAIVRREGEDFLVERAGEQASYMLGSFARSNALARIPAGPLKLEAGAQVDFLPHFWEEI